MVVSAEVLAHAVDEHDDARDGLALVRGPAIARELRAVRGTVGERLGGHHEVAIRIIRRTLKWSDRKCQASITGRRPTGRVPCLDGIRNFYTPVRTLIWTYIRTDVYYENRGLGTPS